MDELRPNLVGVSNLLGVGGLLEDHHGHLGGNGVDKSNTRKCNNASGSSAEDFSAIYGGLQHGHDHHGHTPAHTPPSNRTITDHTAIGKPITRQFIAQPGSPPKERMLEEICSRSSDLDLVRVSTQHISSV
nr:unnamed protein product [Callosobruchus analis]